MQDHGHAGQQKERSTGGKTIALRSRRLLRVVCTDQRKDVRSETKVKELVRAEREWVQRRAKTATREIRREGRSRHEEKEDARTRIDEQVQHMLAKEQALAQSQTRNESRST